MGGIQKGDRIPEFKLKDQFGNFRSHADFLGKPLVLFFYPKDDSPGCIIEVCSFRNSYEEFDQLDACIVGVSADDPESHRIFAKKYNLPFTLLADEENTLRDTFGISPSMLGAIPGRETFVFDKDGILEHRFKSQFLPMQHVTQTLKVIRKMLSNSG